MRGKGFSVEPTGAFTGLASMGGEGPRVGVSKRVRKGQTWLRHGFWKELEIWAPELAFMLTC